MEKIIEYIQSRALLFNSPIRGMRHWKSVEKIGMYLCERNNADRELVKMFAYIHDIGRVNEDEDFEHGKRSAEIAKEMVGNKIITGLNEDQLQKLYYACEHHSEADAKSDDITIQTCWDADRLDLWRLRIAPRKELLYTDAGKTTEASEYAKKLHSHFVY
jgi:uncharacterized protein